MAYLQHYSRANSIISQSNTATHPNSVMTYYVAVHQ